MRRTVRAILTSAVLLSLPLLSYSPDASAQMEVRIGPPTAYIASYEPVYYNGFAHYLYRDHWYYRDRVGWHYWDHEPGFLHGYRGGWEHRWHRWR
jgi:hypothetical protein